MKKMRMLLLMAVLTMLLCMVSACAFAEGGYKLGDKVEDFSVTLSDGSTFTLSEALTEKKAVLLNFWASWCSPCKLEMPAMNEAYGKLSDEEIAVLQADVKKAQEARKAAILKKFDKDGDGKLSREERRAMFDEARKKREALIKKYDADGDGKLNDAEKTKLIQDPEVQEMMKRMIGNPPPPPPPSGA